jgi:hypothetical protein
MKIIINFTKQAEEKDTKQHCTQTFETSEGQLQNSYVCGQGRFTSAEMWNVLKQKRQFSMKG